MGLSGRSGCGLRGAQQKYAGARGRFSHAQEWSAQPDILKQVQALRDLTCVVGELGWYVVQFLCSCALVWMLGCCVYETQAAVMLAVQGRVCKRAAVEQPIPCGVLMCHVMGAAYRPDLYVLPSDLPNVRKRGTLPTDRALHVPNSGRTPQAAIAAAARFGMVRPRVWEVQTWSYRWGVTHSLGRHERILLVCFDSNSTRTTEARVEGARSAIFLAREGVVIPFTTYAHTPKHTHHPRCQSRLWVLRKTYTIVARVHRR